MCASPRLHALLSVSGPSGPCLRDFLAAVACVWGPAGVRLGPAWECAPGKTIHMKRSLEWTEGPCTVPPTPGESPSQSLSPPSACACPCFLGFSPSVPLLFSFGPLFLPHRTTPRKFVDWVLLSSVPPSVPRLALTSGSLPLPQFKVSVTRHARRRRPKPSRVAPPFRLSRAQSRATFDVVVPSRVEWPHCVCSTSRAVRHQGRWHVCSVRRQSRIAQRCACSTGAIQSRTGVVKPVWDHRRVTHAALVNEWS